MIARIKRALAVLIFRLLAALVAYTARRIAGVQISLSKLLVARPGEEGAAQFCSSVGGTCVNFACRFIA